MRLTKAIAILLGLATTVATSSCQLLGSILSSLDEITNATNGVSRDSSGQGWEERDSLHPVKLTELGETVGTAYLPSSGDVNVLVLPIEFTDQPFEASFMTDLDHALNGNGKDDTGYWESVASFYEKSSYGKVHLHFEIAPSYNSNLTQYNAYNQYNNNGVTDNGAFLLKSAWENYANAKNTADPDYIDEHFDADNDGWIDGIVAVYSGKDSTQGGLTYDTNNYYWAYTFWAVAVDSSTNGHLTWTSPSDKNSPKPNLYFWLSYDFLYRAATSPNVDAHTLIHETGHMFGLDDYYPETGSTYNAAGAWSMMDQNILDLDVFSKMLLGWATPVVVTDSGSVSINPAPSSGDCILIPSGNWNGTVYDEYMLVEFYTPTNLNYHDAHNVYPGRQKGYSTSGIKIYHVDARLVSYAKNGPISYSYVEDIASLANLSYSSMRAYMIAATNCQKKASRCNPAFSLLHMMQSSGMNTFISGGVGSNEDLFTTAEGRNIFSMSKFGIDTIFPNTNRFNNGDAFDYVIKVEAIANDYATISFTKAA